MDLKNTCFLLRKKRFILFTFSEDSIYHGKERVVNLDTSHKRQLMQEKERQKKGWGRYSTKGAHSILLLSVKLKPLTSLLNVFI